MVGLQNATALQQSFARPIYNNLRGSKLEEADLRLKITALPLRHLVEGPLRHTENIFELTLPFQ